MANEPTKGSRVYQQIEQSADYYEPSIYASLQFTNLFQALPDPASEQFIPITSPAANKFGEPGNNGKIFAVGLLPPTCNVSGRFLDRSATVANNLGSGAGEVEIGGAISGGGGSSSSTSKYGSIITVPGYTIPLGTGNPDLGIPLPPSTQNCRDNATAVVNDGKSIKYNCYTSVSMAQLYQGLYTAYYNKYNKPPTPTEIQFLTAQCWRETSGNFPGNNPGYLGNKTENPGGWNGYQLPDPEHPGQTKTEWYITFDKVSDGLALYVDTVGKNPNSLEAARNGDVMGFITSLAQAGYYGCSANTYYEGFRVILSTIAGTVTQAQLGDGRDLPKSGPNTCAFKEKLATYTARVKAAGATKTASQYRFNENSLYGPDCPLEGSEAQTDNSTPNWQGTGAANAKQAKKEENKNAGQDLNRTELGKAYQQYQQVEILETQRQLEVMKNTPPLRMLVNPESFDVSSEKIISDGNWTRSGPVIQHWGDGQDKITGSGKIAGFYSVDVQNANGPGLTRTARNYSMAYQNFMSLWLLYRNNGGLLFPDLSNLLNPTWLLSVVGSIYIYYDGIIYIGSFDSFNVNETDTAPFTLEYDFSFTVRAWYELDREDPPQFQYGDSSGMFKLGGVPTAPTEQEWYEAAENAGEARKKQAILDMASAKKAEEATAAAKAAPYVKSSAGKEADTLFDHSASDASLNNKKPSKGKGK